MSCTDICKKGCNEYMANGLQKLIYNMSVASPLLIVFAFVWYIQKKSWTIPITCVVIAIVLILGMLRSFSYGKKHLAPIQIIDEIKDAIRDPLGTTSYQKQEGVFPEIKAVFVGERTENENSERFNIAFQRFRKEQYISTRWYNLFFNNDTFFRQDSFGISISDSIDCFYTNGELQFVSFFFARQVFDLGEYYRSATDGEVTAFASNANLEIEDTDAFGRMADTGIRRKIAMINDSRVLDEYAASDIAQRAAEVGVSIITNGNRIVLPNDKKQIKVILGFLDEEAYKGPFSQNTYLANSKRQINGR